MKSRTYEQAVDLMIEFWVDKSFNKDLINQQTGSDMKGFVLHNMISDSVKSGITSQQITIFKDKLKHSLMLGNNEERRSNELDVDYNPDIKLSEACELAQIDSTCLPCKTYTYIEKDNIVHIRYGYRAPWTQI